MQPPAVTFSRVVSLDAFRGMVMMLMVGEVVQFGKLAAAFPRNALYAQLDYHSSHVEWQGASLHDLIQPGFSFLAGASLPFSIASRKAKGETFAHMFAHVLWRSLLLIALGIFLRSFGRPQTYFTFEDTLTQIGLGYPFLFLLAWISVRKRLMVLAAILAGYWLAFVIYPIPAAGFDYAAVGVPPNWPHLYGGFFAHWNKNSNFAWAFDTWFLNLLPREQPFQFNKGGYATLSFIPTLGTMLLGQLAGEWLRLERATKSKLIGLLAAGMGCTLAGLLLQWLGICPIVKRIWTPAFTLYSGGLVLLLLAGFYGLIEWRGWKTWAFPLVVVGMNSIAIYVMAHTMEEFIAGALNRHIGGFGVLGPEYETLLLGSAVMLVFWLILYWLYRRRMFLRI